MSDNGKKCINCLFSEISLRHGATDKSGKHISAKLWCWYRETHVSRNHTCKKWKDQFIRGDPRRIALHLRGEV